MADLKQILQENGLKDVKTYIQSGNIVFDSDQTDKNKLQKKIIKTIDDHFGFDVPTLVLRQEDIKSILKANPYLKQAEETKLYYVLLKSPPKEELVEKFNQIQFENEAFHITKRCVYLLCKNGYGKAKLNNNLLENKLKVEATTRNHKTMLKLLEMVSS